MYCGKCGAENQDGNYCAVCGFQNRGQQKIANAATTVKPQQPSQSNETNQANIRLTFWDIIGVLFGLSWIVTGFGIMSSSDCNSVSLEGGSRYTVSLACSSSGSGGQGVGFLLLLVGAAIILFSLRGVLFNKKD